MLLAQIRFGLRNTALLTALSLACIAPAPVSAEQFPASPLNFETHAAAYAQESDAHVEIDPHVFVADPNAPDTTGPEGIRHIAGIRPARVADSSESPLENAQGDALDLSLFHWLATQGTAVIRNDDGPRLELRFTHLIPFGVYSLFSSRNDGGSYSFTPLKTEDGVATFNAPGDGLLHLTLPLDHQPARDEAILLVYHSDDTDHQEQPGDLGVNAHVQLVLLPGSTPGAYNRPILHRGDTQPNRDDAPDSASDPSDNTPL